VSYSNQKESTSAPAVSHDVEATDLDLPQENKDIPSDPVTEFQNLDYQLVEGDWAVIRYNLTHVKGECRWIGCIIRVNENDTYHIRFVRSQRTRLHSGFLYAYSKTVDGEEDEETVYKTQIVSRPRTQNFPKKIVIHSSLR